MEKVFDVHTHLNPEDLGSKSLKGILNYHFVLSEMISCGCPIYKFKNLKDEEWMEIILPYLKKIKNTSTYWMIRRILQDLYEIDIEKLDEKNWELYDQKIREKYKDSEWIWEVIKKSNIHKIFTSRDFPLNHKEEIFGRTYEKIPFGIREDLDYKEVWEKILNGKLNLDNLKKFLKDEVKKAYDLGVYAFVFWVGRYPFRNVSEAEVETCIEKNDKKNIREILSCFVFQFLLEKISLLENPPVIQMIIGAHVDRIPYTEYSRIFDISNSDILYSYQKVFDAYNNLHFDILVSSSIRSRELDTIARMCPNVTLTGNWLHTMFPNQIKKIFSDRLEFIPFVKLGGFFSDSYSVEWLYGKLVLVEKCIKEVVDERIKEGFLREDHKNEILNSLFWENPYRIYIEKRSNNG